MLISCPVDQDGNPIDHVPGLEYYRGFLSPLEQAELLNLIDSNPWQEGVIARRQQFYGEVYYHTSFKSKVLQGCANGSGDEENTDTSNIGNSDAATNDKIGSNSSCDDTKMKGHGNANGGISLDDSGMRKWLEKTMPLFRKEGLMESPTQVLINEYKNNMGIASHFEDFEAFGPVILTISLVSPVYMTLKKPTTDTTTKGGDDNNNINAGDSYDDVVKVLLEPGSLLVMKGDARYKYRHGIGKYKWVHLPPGLTQPRQAIDDCSVPLSDPGSGPPLVTPTTRIKRDDSYRRVSLTVRHLLSTRRRVREEEDESDTIKDPSVY